MCKNQAFKLKFAKRNSVVLFLVADSGDIAFMASSTVTQYVRNSRGNAIFNKVKVNKMECYNPLNGKFTAPTDGLYLFYFSLNLNANSIHVRMYVNNRITSTTMDYRNYPSGTFMVQLNKGQTVYMKFNTHVNVYGNTYTWFGGHLITEE